MILFVESHSTVYNAAESIRIAMHRSYSKVQCSSWSLPQIGWCTILTLYGWSWVFVKNWKILPFVQKFSLIAINLGRPRTRVDMYLSMLNDQELVWTCLHEFVRFFFLHIYCPLECVAYSHGLHICMYIYIWPLECVANSHGLYIYIGN